ncbi:hypothetical protein BGZ80_006114 [Entomortierella chlamydospora]|uniref:Uncharacterized protein n=1 Tax=Entomortierella chlamydospora TaxID=101097 RepID=A0A9P6STL9_9FUNG|nr:hypothetical protein BGZ80_006114 [Entomortierella chlamydospora]
MTTAATLRITIALALAALISQAAPCDIGGTSDIGTATDMGFNDLGTPVSLQSVNSGSTSLGSTVNAIPITNVNPINRYQPVIQAFAPIVQSECYGDYDGSILGPDYGWGSQLYRRDSGLSDTSSYSTLNAPYSSPLDSSSSDYGMGLWGQGQSDCDTSVPSQNVDLGSSVSVIPSTQVAPSTFYQPHVSSLESNIQAASAQSNYLPQQDVDLGSNVSIQPTTQVLPQTTYQLGVHQLTTSIEAASQDDQSLPQSSVQLGSNVLITPTVDLVVRTLVDLHPTPPSLIICHHPMGCTEARPMDLVQMTKTILKIIKVKIAKAIQLINATKITKTRLVYLTLAIRAITKARRPMDLSLMFLQIKDDFKNL